MILIPSNMFMPYNKPLLQYSILWIIWWNLFDGVIIKSTFLNNTMIPISCNISQQVLKHVLTHELFLYFVS